MNSFTNRTTSYRTEFDIKVNERNPYYEYPSQPASITILGGGIYSKEADFDIASGGFATFYYDSGSPSPMAGLHITYLNSPDYTDVDEPYGICCTAPSARLAYPIEKDKTTNSSWLSIYPNPANGYLIIDATLSYDEPSAKISVNDLSGKQLFTKQLNISNKKINHTFSVAEMKLAKGIYFIQLETNI